MRTVHRMIGHYYPHCLRCGKSAIQIGANPLAPCVIPQPGLPFVYDLGVPTGPDAGVGTGTGTGKSAP